MPEKPPYQADKTYVPRRVEEPGVAPALLLPGEIGSNESDGTLHVRRSNGSTSTLPTAQGFHSIVTLSQTEYDALVAATATISTTLYVVTPDGS